MPPAKSALTVPALIKLPAGLVPRVHTTFRGRHMAKGGQLVLDPPDEDDGDQKGEGGGNDEGSGDNDGGGNGNRDDEVEDAWLRGG